MTNDKCTMHNAQWTMQSWTDPSFPPSDASIAGSDHAQWGVGKSNAATTTDAGGGAKDQGGGGTANPNSQTWPTSKNDLKAMEMSVILQDFLAFGIWHLVFEHLKFVVICAFVLWHFCF